MIHSTAIKGVYAFDCLDGICPNCAHRDQPVFSLKRSWVIRITTTTTNKIPAGNVPPQAGHDYEPGTASIEVLARASRSQDNVANIRCPSEALSGIRDKQASSVSP